MITLAEPPIVDVAFPVRPSAAALSTIPADHGYTLFAAISRAIPFVHGNNEIGIHPVTGMLAGGRRLRITRDSVITLRLSADLISNVLPLAGLEVDLAGAKVTVGAARVRPLIPVAAVRSRLVVIKGMLDAQALLDAARIQLDALGIGGTATIPSRREISSFEPDGIGSHDRFQRRTLQVRDKVIVGYSMVVEGLTAEESVCLQENGIGGRRRFGCGVFVPIVRL